MIFILTYFDILFIFIVRPGLQVHPWFRGTPWDKLYDMEAAFKPEVTSELDTQNFEKFEEVRSQVEILALFVNNL